MSLSSTGLSSCVGQDCITIGTVVPVTGHRVNNKGRVRVIEVIVVCLLQL